ncbi:BnaC03g54830D [Brassica napus]|uniref:BnaC03g54830D protein n=1 Tax=Brassica napus TaxID=3708 RepID=A0A078F6L3_BRANA|nr:BnaC03g54830D [Brassica napus]
MSIDYDFLLPDEFGIFRDSDGHARAMDGRILQVSREDIADILQLANGADNLFMQQRRIPDNNPAVPDEYPRATTTGIGSHNRADQLAKHRSTRRYECGRRAYDSYGARKFRWEQKDEYGVYRDESGHARSMAGEMIPVTKDNIRKILERASLFEESHICLPEHATSFTPTRLAPEIYTKDEINEMVTGICGAQEKLGDELKTLVDDTYQPLDRGYNELFRSMAEMRTEIESMQHSLEKEATTSPSIDANKATSIDVKPQTSQTPAEPESLAEKKDEWEIVYINTRINDVYYPLNNNVDWLSTRIDLLQQDLDTIRMNDPQPATSIDICNITSIDTRFAAMEDRLKSYEDMHDRFTSPIMRYWDTLSTQMMNVQKDIGKLNDQHDFQEEGSTSIDRFRRTSLDGKKPTEHLPYTAAEVDQITSKLYTAIETLEGRPEKRCDDIYFPFNVKLSGLDSQAERLQKEIKAIQRQLASQHQISASIDRGHSKSIDTDTEQQGVNA